MFSRKVFESLYSNDLLGGADADELGDVQDTGGEDTGAEGDVGTESSLFMVPGFLKNQYVVIFGALICILYANYFVPKLPDSVIQFFDSLIGRFIFISLIAFVSTRNLMLSMLIAE